MPQSLVDARTLVLRSGREKRLANASVKVPSIFMTMRRAAADVAQTVLLPRVLAYVFVISIMCIILFLIFQKQRPQEVVGRKQR